VYLGIPGCAISSPQFLYGDGGRDIATVMHAGLGSRYIEPELMAKNMLISDNLHLGSHPALVAGAVHNKDVKTARRRVSRMSANMGSLGSPMISPSGTSISGAVPGSMTGGTSIPLFDDSSNGNPKSDKKRKKRASGGSDAKVSCHPAPINMVIRNVELNDQLSTFVLLPWSARLTHPAAHYAQDVKKILMKEIRTACEEALLAMSIHHQSLL
jgi:hypothetical protein